MSIKSKTIQSVKWSFAGTVGKLILQLGVTSILARMLDPKEYGLIALAALFTNFGFRFSRMGLGPVLIQCNEISEIDIRGSFTLAFAMGLLFGIICFFSAPLGAFIFDDTEVAAVIRVMAILFLIQGIALTPQSLLRRNLNYKALSKIEIFSFFIGNGVVAITLAFFGFGVWSLIAGMFVAQGLTAGISVFLTRHSMRPIFKKNAYDRIFPLCARFSLVGLLDFLYSNMNAFFVGFLFGPISTGLYDRAHALGRLPPQTVTLSINPVMFATMSRMQDQDQARNQLFLFNFLLQGILCAAFAGAMAVASHEIVFVVLGEKWASAALPLQFMALFSCLEYLTSSLASTLESSGQLLLRYRARFFGLFLAIPIYFLVAPYGFEKFFVTILCLEGIQFFIHLFFVARYFHIWNKALQFTTWIFVNGIVTAILTWITTVSALSIGLTTEFVLVCQIIASAISLAVALFFVWKKLPQHIKDTLLPHVPFFKLYKELGRTA